MDYTTTGLRKDFRSLIKRWEDDGVLLDDIPVVLEGSTVSVAGARVDPGQDAFVIDGGSAGALTAASLLQNLDSAADLPVKVRVRDHLHALDVISSTTYGQGSPNPGMRVIELRITAGDRTI